MYGGRCPSDQPLSAAVPCTPPSLVSLIQKKANGHRDTHADCHAHALQDLPPTSPDGVEHARPLLAHRHSRRRPRRTGRLLAHQPQRVAVPYVTLAHKVWLGGRSGPAAPRVADQGCGQDLAARRPVVQPDPAGSGRTSQMLVGTLGAWVAVCVAVGCQARC